MGTKMYELGELEKSNLINNTESMGLRWEIRREVPWCRSSELEPGTQLVFIHLGNRGALFIDAEYPDKVARNLGVI